MGEVWPTRADLGNLWVEGPRSSALGASRTGSVRDGARRPTGAVIRRPAPVGERGSGPPEPAPHQGAGKAESRRNPRSLEPVRACALSLGARRNPTSGADIAPNSPEPKPTSAELGAGAIRSRRQRRFEASDIWLGLDTTLSGGASSRPGRARPPSGRVRPKLGQIRPIRVLPKRIDTRHIGVSFGYTAGWVRAASAVCKGSVKGVAHGRPTAAARSWAGGRASGRGRARP